MAVTGINIDTLDGEPLEFNRNRPQVVVANRGAGNLSIIDGRRGEHLFDVDVLSDGETTSEPMYVQYLRSTGEILFNDRANSEVVFIDADTYELTETAPTGNGGFHMVANLKETQIWVTNDIDDTVTVLDPVTKAVIATIELPEEVIGTNALPHDVWLDANGEYGYVGIFQNDNPESDLLLKIDASTFEIVDTAATDKGAHFVTSPGSPLLYLLAEGGDSVQIFDRRGDSLTEVGTIDSPGPHGISSSRDGQYTYISNLPGGGDNGLFAIDNVTNEIVGDLDGVDTPFSVPHNIVITPDGRNLFLTHSGPNTNTSFYSLNDPTTPALRGSVDTGNLNPFGLSVTARPGDNLFVGSEDADDIRVRAGHDIVFAGDGRDSVRGGVGNDTLLGEDGRDLLFGNKGRDLLVGGSGNDLVSGGLGNDILIGVDTDSFAPGDRDVDRLLGGGGRDTFVLGDALNSYYEGRGRALVQDFSAQQGDVIRLHGAAEEYFLNETNRGTQIFRLTEEDNDPIGDSQVGVGSALIGFVRGEFDLDLNSDSFEYSSLPTNLITPE